MLLESRKAIFFIFYSDIAYIIAATFSKSFFSMKKTFKLSKLFRRQVNPWINLYLDLFVYRYRKIINIQVSPCNLHTK